MTSSSSVAGSAGSSISALPSPNPFSPSRSTIHNWVVADIARRIPDMTSNRWVTSPRIRTFGVVDLVHLRTGEVWEVKRDTQSISRAQRQIGRYTAEGARLWLNTITEGEETFRNLHQRQLVLGGSEGTTIPTRVILQNHLLRIYTVTYWDFGGGIIQYDFTWGYNWDAVRAAAAVGCATALYIFTKGAYKPDWAIR